MLTLYYFETFFKQVKIIKSIKKKLDFFSLIFEILYILYVFKLLKLYMIIALFIKDTYCKRSFYINKAEKDGAL